MGPSAPYRIQGVCILGSNLSLTVPVGKVDCDDELIIVDARSLKLRTLNLNHHRSTPFMPPPLLDTARLPCGQAANQPSRREFLLLCAGAWCCSRPADASSPYEDAKTMKYGLTEAGRVRACPGSVNPNCASSSSINQASNLPLQYCSTGCLRSLTGMPSPAGCPG